MPNICPYYITAKLDLFAKLDLYAILAKLDLFASMCQMGFAYSVLKLSISELLPTLSCLSSSLKFGKLEENTQTFYNGR